MKNSDPLDVGSCFRLNPTGLVFLFLRSFGPEHWDVLVTAPSGQWEIRRYTEGRAQKFLIQSERRLTRVA